jgi:hypothetical protein
LATSTDVPNRWVSSFSMATALNFIAAHPDYSADFTGPGKTTMDKIRMGLIKSYPLEASAYWVRCAVLSDMPTSCPMTKRLW